MKSSFGATRLAPTVTFCALFLAGAIFQARGMRDADMGVVYIAVLGIEAVLALAAATLILHERLSWTRIAAVTLVVAGIALLRRS